MKQMYSALAGDMKLARRSKELQGVLAGHSMAVVPAELIPSTHHDSSIDWMVTVLASGLGDRREDVPYIVLNVGL